MKEASGSLLLAVNIVGSLTVPICLDGYRAFRDAASPIGRAGFAQAFF